MTTKKNPGRSPRRSGRAAAKRRRLRRPQDGKPIAVSTTECDISDRKWIESAVREIVALEQRRIGQDLHDTAGQELTGLGLIAETLVEDLRTHASPDVELAGKLLNGIRRALGQVRTLAQGLVPLEIDSKGLMPALTDLAARTMELYGVACTFESVAGLAIQHDATATHLFRIAQEAIINAVKHGRARRIAIGLGAQDGEITLRVRDDGCGIDVRKKSGAGMGLPIMRYRAGILHGQLTIEPAKGGGTVVSCTLSDREGAIRQEALKMNQPDLGAE